MRSLHQGGDEILAGVGADGTVTVEGHFVGKLAGIAFEAARGASALENRALRGAAERVAAPEIARRLGLLAADADDAFALTPDGMVLWRADIVGKLSGGGPFSPRVRLLGELGPTHARERATRRLEAFVAAEASARLFSKI
jgi:ATP-dependent RNA helicase SUPV3L1/SUV3